MFGDRFPLLFYVFLLICLGSTSLFILPSSHSVFQLLPTTTMYLHQCSECFYLFVSPFDFEFVWLVAWKFIVLDHCLPHYLDLRSVRALRFEFGKDFANLHAVVLLQSFLDLDSDGCGDVVR